MDISGTGGVPGREPDDEDVLRATVELCREKGYAGLTVADVAARVGASADDLLRRWSSKAALVVSAFRRVVAADLRYAETGDFRADLREQLVSVARVLTDPALAPVLTELVAEAQRDHATARTFVEHVFQPNREAARERFAKARRDGQLRDDVDLEVAIDVAFAPLWFRFLLRTGPLSADYAAQVADAALAGLGATDVTSD
jgi:AcrR family transcriptional regulator